MNFAPMYNPITDTIGTTDRPQKQPTKAKTTINRRFKNFVKFNTHWNFKRVHAQHCQGHFAPAPHWKEESKGSRTPTAKEVCTVCGAVSFQRFYNLGEISTIGYRLQKSRQHSKDYEVVFEGYIPKKLLRVDNPDQDHKKATFENTCLSCQLGFNGKSFNGLCPSCANNERSDVNTIAYDDYASSHAGYIESWQQGQYDEVQSDKKPQYHKKLKIQQWKYNSIMAQMHKSDTWDEEQTLLRKLNNIMKYNDKIHSAELTKKQKAIKARPTLFNPRDYERRVKNAGKNAFELMHSGKEDQETKTKPYVLMVTGHRPQKIPNSDKVKLKMLEFIKAKQEEHPDITLISGMALGVDTMFAEIGLKLGIPVIAFVPFKAQAQRWPKQAQKHYNDLLNKVITTITVCKEYSNAAYFKRNDAMVHASNECLAVWDGSTGGTMHAVHSAQKKGINTTIINP